MAGYGPLIDGEVVLPVSSERVGEWDLSDVMRAERDGLHLSLLTCQRSGASPATQPKPFKSADPRPRKLCRHTIKVGDQERSAALVERIQNTLHTTFPPRRLLCIINPMAGGRKAEKMFDRQAKPVLESAGAMLDVRVTTAAGDATAWAYAVPLHSFDGIAVVGGDGTVNEVSFARGVASSLLLLPSLWRAIPAAFLPSSFITNPIIQVVTTCTLVIM